MKPVYHNRGDTCTIVFSAWNCCCASLCRAAGWAGGWAEEDGAVSRAAALWYFLLQSLKIERKEVLIIPPRCLLQSFRGGDSLGFRNASLRRRGWQIPANPNFPGDGCCCQAQLQGKPFSKHRSNFTLSLLHGFASQRNGEMQVMLQMIQFTYNKQTHKTHTNTNKDFPLLNSLFFILFFFFFPFKRSWKFKLHCIQQTGFQVTKPKPNISSFVGLSTVPLRAFSKNKYNWNIILRLLESMTKLAN